MSTKASPGSFEALRAACCEGNRKLPQLGIVDLTFGNLSVCDRDLGVMAIKPSGVDYDVLTPGDIVLVSLEGEKEIKVHSGHLKPSSDTPTHKCLYRSFRQVNCIVHTHSRRATAFAQAGLSIPCFGTTHADFFCGEVPVTREMTPEEVSSDYEWNTGKVIVDRFSSLDPSATEAVLIRHHGPFVWGSSVSKALDTAYALEVIAEMALDTLRLENSAAVIPKYLHEKHFKRKHGPQAYYGQENPAG